MRIDNLSLPHPVLGVGDDVDGLFNVSFAVALTLEITKLHIKSEITNDTLNNMIKTGDAAVNIEVHCPKTLYRKSFLAQDNEEDIEIETSLLRGMVYVDFYVTAAKDKNNYTINNANADYNGYFFEVRKGDVLAWGGHAKFPALKDWSALKAADSFLEIEKYNEDTGPIKINLSREKIIVQLPRIDFEQYKFYAQHRSLFPIYHSSLVLPVLIYALTNMKEHPGEYEGLGWFDILDFRKKEEENLSDFDWNSTDHIPFIAQRLLNNPVGRMLKATGSLIKMIQEGE